MILIGSNITETNPLTAVRIKEAIRVYKAQVVVIDSAVTNMAKLASHPVLIKPGTEGLVIDGLVKAALELDLIDETSVKKHPWPSKPSRLLWPMSRWNRWRHRPACRSHR